MSKLPFFFFCPKNLVGIEISKFTQITIIFVYFGGGNITQGEGRKT